ncbi:MAG: RNA methyltransferase, partial [Desulfobacula sp.]|nr:RNA methyltransferase [Desulfobacula sp.]
AMLSWAGFSNKDILIDPMCGSGTFSLEAAMVQSNIPSGFFRTFAFENWPGCSLKTFAYMKKQAHEKFRKFTCKQIFASDIDDTALAALEQNLSKHDFCKVIAASKKDFFAINPSDILHGISHDAKGVVMLNPPYGKRLETKNDNGSFYGEIGKKLKKDFKGWRVALVLPSRASKASLGIRLELKPLFHGGLDIFAGIGRIE